MKNTLSKLFGRGSLLSSYPPIGRIAEELNLPEETIEEANKLFQNAASRNLLRGRSAEKIMGGSIYAAGRRKNSPRTFTEISKILDIEEKKLYKGYKHLVRNLNIDIPPVDPNDCLEYMIKRLGLSSKTKEKAKEIIEKAINCGLASGRCPFGTAAASIYLACKIKNNHIAQKNIKNVANVSEVTIRSRIKEITEELHNDFNFSSDLEELN